MISPPTYEIYAVKYAGPFIRPVAKVLWNTDWEKEIKINYYIWVVKGNEETFVVDSGVAPPLAQEMGLQGYVSPVHVLARMGIDASDIKKVVITHIHFDHANGIELFPNATFYIQEKEFNFWIKDPLAKKPPFLMLSDLRGNANLAKLEGTERLVLLKRDQVLLPGIELFLAPLPVTNATLSLKCCISTHSVVSDYISWANSGCSSSTVIAWREAGQSASSSRQSPIHLCIERHAIYGMREEKIKRRAASTRLREAMHKKYYRVSGMVTFGSPSPNHSLYFL